MLCQNKQLVKSRGNLDFSYPASSNSLFQLNIDNTDYTLKNYALKRKYRNSEHGHYLPDAITATINLNRDRINYSVLTSWCENIAAGVAMGDRLKSRPPGSRQNYILLEARILEVAGIGEEVGGEETNSILSLQKLSTILNQYCGRNRLYPINS